MINFDPPTLKLLIICFIWFDYLWEQYLCYRQFKKIKSTQEIPEEMKSTFAKSTFEVIRKRTLQKKRFNFFKDHMNVLISTVIIHFDFLPISWNYFNSLNPVRTEIFANCWWYFLFSTTISIVMIPLTIYEKFVIQENRWERDYDPLMGPCNALVNFFSANIFAAAISALVVLIIRKGDDVLIGVWSCFCLLVAILGTTFPMMPPSRFRIHTPLEDGPLKNQIKDLAKFVNFPLEDVIVEERLKNSPPYNIYYYGSPNSKNLVIYDTIFSQESGCGCSNEQVLALVAHQLGKWYNRNNTKYILTIETNLLLSFIGFFLTLKNPIIYEIFGFHEHKPILIGVYVIMKYVLIPFSNLISFAFICCCRLIIFQDDLFVVKLGMGKTLASALARLEQNTKDFPVNDRLYSAWHYDKPYMMERVEAIKRACGRKFE